MNALIAAAIARLTAADLGYRTLSTIEALADLETQAVAYPAGFVVPAGESFVPEQEGTLLVVRADTEFDVVTIVQGAVRPGQRQAELTALAGAARDALFGWTPDADVWRPLVPVQSRLLGVAAGRASWITRFRTVTRLRKTGAA